MPAIITDSLRRRVISQLTTDISDTTNNHYYIAIGRGEIWDAQDNTPVPYNSVRDVRLMQNSMQSMIQVAAHSQVVPRNNWSNNSLYSSYDDATVEYPIHPYYVLSDVNRVYICIRQGTDILGTATLSTIQPTGVSVNPFETADGYIWKFCYSLNSVDANNFLAANFFPVKYIDTAAGASDGALASEVEQASVHNAAVSGQINTIQVTNGGSGYTGTPTVAILGDGAGAQATAFVSGGSVVKIEIDDSAGGLFGAGSKMGSGYNFASVAITGGGVSTGAAGQAIARATISPKLGFGYDPTEDLKATALMFSAKPTGSQNNDFVIGNDFRQVALVRNPKQWISADSDYTDGTGTCLKHLKLSNIVSDFTPDAILLGSVSAAKAILDAVVGNDLYYHQDEATGFKDFNAGEAISETIGIGAGTISPSMSYTLPDATTVNPAKFIPPDINPHSGDLLFLDNRGAVVRSNEQTEDIKIIVKV
jgi:hypothetical protein